MDLLTIKHQDFTLIVECSKFDDVWEKAVSNVGADELHSTYSWSEGVEFVKLGNEESDTVLQNGEQGQAVFFDNTDYPIWVEFDKGIRQASFGSALQNDNDVFSFRRSVLTGYLNYKNEIGKSELRLVYQKGEETRYFTFGYEVLSTKLSYHSHWRSIIEDIESEYRLLSLDYMRRTFHGFTPDTQGETPELVWWSVFAQEQKNFLRACQNIIDRPHRQLHGRETYKRADRLTYVPRSIENELAEHRLNPAHLYRVEERVQTNNTPENRFLKFALKQIAGQYEKLKGRIESLQNASDVFKADMNETSQKLKYLQHHPFFRTVGHFKGLNQESMVLQKATGYSQVYRTWSLLRRGYSLNDGMYRLQTKDIATLYEIWCFIEVSHIVKEQLHLDETEVEQRNRMEMNGLFTWELGKGEHSRILFKKDGVQLAELVYNPKSTANDNASVGMKQLVVPTVPQKPDIVLQLTKNDLKSGMKFTYLFDAKYRIEKDRRNRDVPPDDTLNQMHRYRDAIYYEEYKGAALKKEVIGGYILFPGDGTSLEIQEENFYQSIEKVNIGAFPLRPKDEQNRKLLEDFIHTLIEKKSAEVMEKVIPQKGTFVDAGNRVLIGAVKKTSSRVGYVQSFEDGNAALYYTGSHFPTTISLQNLHFFIPYLSGKGIRDVYEIVRLRTITAKEAKQMDGEEIGDDLRLAFELRKSRKLSDDFCHIPTAGFIKNTFLDTTFDHVENLMLEEE